MLGGGAGELPGYCEARYEWASVLLAVDADHADLWILLVPVGGYGVENQAEVAVLPRFDGGGRDWLGIDVGLAGADQAEREGHSLGILADIAMEADLDGDRGEGSIPVFVIWPSM